MYRKAEWKIPINMKIVNYTLKMIREYPVSYDNEEKIITKIDRSVESDNKYIIPNVRINRETEGAIYFTDDNLLRLHHTWYPVRFSVPKISIVSCDNDILYSDTITINERNIPADKYIKAEIGDTINRYSYPLQDIIINKWAYENCYIEALNRILQKHGKRLISLLMADPELSSITASEYGGFVIRVQLNYNKKHKSKIKNENKKRIKEENNKMDNKEHDIPEAKHIFYTDGSGNITNNKKFKDKGHYSILLETTGEKWRHDDDALTSNQAELKGILAALYISIKRGYNSIEIRTDSQNSINWASEIWNARSPNIVDYVTKIIEFKSKLEYVKFTKILRAKNKAHPI